MYKNGLLVPELNISGAPGIDPVRGRARRARDDAVYAGYQDISSHDNRRVRQIEYGNPFIAIPGRQKRCRHGNGIKGDSPL